MSALTIHETPASHLRVLPEPIRTRSLLGTPTRICRACQGEHPVGATRRITYEWEDADRAPTVIPLCRECADTLRIYGWTDLRIRIWEELGEPSQPQDPEPIPF